MDERRNKKGTDWQRWNQASQRKEQTEWPENRPTTGLGVLRGLEWATKRAKVSSSPGRSTTWASYATMMDTSCIILTPLAPSNKEEERMKKNKEEEEEKWWRGKRRGVQLTGFASLWEWRRRLAACKSPSWARPHPLRGGGAGWSERAVQHTCLFLSLSVTLEVCDKGRWVCFFFLSTEWVLSLSLPPSLSLSYTPSLGCSLEVFSVSCCW